MIRLGPWPLCFVRFFPALFLFVGGCPDEPQERDGGPADAWVADAAEIFDTAPPASCEFGGSYSQAFGDPCGCEEDCIPSASRCSRNPLQDLTGPDYCTKLCLSSASCPEGFGCLTQLLLLGQEPFCQRCASPVRQALGLNESCICDEDCGSTTVDDRDRDLRCIQEICAISPCSDSTARRCPDGYTCEEFPMGDKACVECINAEPAPEWQSCACGVDCQEPLTCTSGTCRQACELDSDCGEGRECRQQLAGGGLCRDLSDRCTHSSDLGIGDPCVCNADCGELAPICLTLEIAGYPVSLCTVRPCDTGASNTCPQGRWDSFRCCEAATMMPATCVPQTLAGTLGALATCSPE